MKRLILALQFLTRLPLPRIPATAEDLTASMRYFPVAGLVVGGVVTGAVWAGSLLDSWTGALAGVTAWAWFTGALHLDGLGDLADGLGAGHRDSRRMVEVMADAHTGTFAVVSILLQLLAKLILLHGLILVHMDWWPLVLVPFAARIGPLLWVKMLPQLHRGLGARFVGVIRVTDVLLWLLILLFACWVWPPLLAAFLLMLLFGIWLGIWVGGVSGDCHDAGIEVVETGLLLAFLIVITQS